jgi:hypothetical protein
MRELMRHNSPAGLLDHGKAAALKRRKQTRLAAA